MEEKQRQIFVFKEAVTPKCKRVMPEATGEDANAESNAVEAKEVTGEDAGSNVSETMI